MTPTYESMTFSTSEGASLDECHRLCQQLTKRAAQNFHFAFLTLPRPAYRHMCALYAFMRVCDDLSDDPELTAEERSAFLRRWREDLGRTLAGEQGRSPVLRAVGQLVRERQIPIRYFEDVITGVELDLTPRTIHTFAELESYCYHVAGAVGLCCIHVWGFRDERAVPLAIDCGLALQLTNILRDLREDAGLGRVYLPAEELSRFGYSPVQLAAGEKTPAFDALMKFQTDRAAEYYRRAEDLFPLLDPLGRPILRVMLSIYGGLLREIRRRHFDVFSSRVSLPKWKKLAYVGRAVGTRGRW